MGLYDRDYLREDDDRPGIGLGGPRSMVANLIIINVVIYVADVLLHGSLGGVPGKPGLLSLKSDTLYEPWNLWQLLTYGFVHAPDDIRHIAFNMLGLFFFGREMETKYGRREFLWQYLAYVVFGGIVWLALSAFSNGGTVIGASGAVTGVLTLFVLNYPQRTILLFGILPVPAWLCLALYLFEDLYGASYSTSNVAYSVHLAGAALAFAYYRLGWNFERWVPANWSKFRFRGPRLRVHRPPPTEQDMKLRVDKILAKWSEKGEQSLTREERKTLEEASRRYRNRSEG
ncbi:MAG TPA: rhomboid family intramembrane serine protease [Pirellulales bacterium]|jgi:membrane associated rhomboid family serine protease|nr:rhomboid family intramembrane serine protease [Pirellulales bacterium]